METRGGIHYELKSAGQTEDHSGHPAWVVAIRFWRDWQKEPEGDPDIFVGSGFDWCKSQGDGAVAPELVNILNAIISEKALELVCFPED